MESIWFATHPPLTVPSASFPDGTHFDTVVAGAGITGLTTAVLLARSGQRVAVVEARGVGAVTTGHTTAKVSVLQGTVLSDIRRHHSDDVLRAYVEGNREGQAWLTRLLDDRGVAYQRRDAWTYAVTDDGVEHLRAELEACREAGLAAAWTRETELPIEVRGAITLPGQAQVHPLEVLRVLLAEFAGHGGVVFDQTRLVDADTKDRVKITTTRGTLIADRLVLATGIPVLDRGGYFAKLVPLRSYATTYRLPGAKPPPQGMYLGIDEDQSRSLRSVPVDDEELLMVGGNGHVVGRSDSEAEAVQGLRRWTEVHFPGAEPLHAWSAQDYRSVNRVPFVGQLPRGGGAILVATGFNKWGLTNGVAAALNLSAQILGGQMSWARTLGTRVSKPAAVVSALGANIEVAVELAKDWVQAELHALPEAPPAEGEGHVGRGRGGKPEAVSTVNGVTCRVSGVCTHLGGVLNWNDAERSWDCPLHGSRFAADGALLEGPAVTDLSRQE